MKQINTGGPAFPVARIMEENVNGMTLRDYFAAKAMQGFAAQGCGWDDGANGMAKCSYDWADAMLEAREK